MCEDNRNLEEILAHGAIGVLGINYDALNAWARSYFNLTDSSWNPWGAFDPNDKARPYGKMINAIFVIGYALTDNQQLQWHATEDYESLASKVDNRFHDDLYYRIITGPGANATTVIPAVGTNHTDMHCPVFREGNPANSASHRAGVMVHEGWHHWQYDKSFSLNHPTGGSAAGWPGGGDWFYPHTLSRFAFGQLHGYSTSPSNFHFHSPYQVQAEFLADVAELSRPQIPTAITQTARARGNAILAGAFVNGASYRIGNPRPW